MEYEIWSIWSIRYGVWYDGYEVQDMGCGLLGMDHGMKEIFMRYKVSVIQYLKWDMLNGYWLLFMDYWVCVLNWTQDMMHQAFDTEYGVYEV